MGSGGLLVMDETTCMVDVAKFFLNFTQSESCGKCTFCRVGTRQMKLILDRITEGQGNIDDLAKLEELASSISQGSLCGLGQTAPNPVLTTLKYFRDEYEKHILDHKCPAKKCRDLLVYAINAEKCTGCGLCRKNCPAGAISGNKKEPHIIDTEKCIHCGVCIDNCKFEAVTAE
jgi:NADH-quinone oxidoreductase subunit F